VYKWGKSWIEKRNNNDYCEKKNRPMSKQREKKNVKTKKNANGMCSVVGGGFF
jgi:hypothetical protein